MSVINDKILVIFGTEKFVIVNVEQEKVIETCEVNEFIEVS